jgi:uncharacterized protein (TIGR02996 family)
MTHADAFLQDILAHPDDDAPRLIFADWLEEQGDANSIARAEFIRIQCTVAGRQLSPQQKAKLERRQEQILNEHEREWAHPIRRLLLHWEFHRGFIDTVEMRAHKFHAHAIQLFSRAPIQHLCLGGHGAEWINMAALAESWHLRNLRSLDLHCNQLESRDVRALFVSGHLTSLTELNLSHNRIGNSGIRALAGAPLLGRLERLNLSGNDIGAGGLRVLAHALEKLARSAEGLRLQRLVLDNLSAAVQRVLADSPLLRQLVRWRD